MTIGIIGGGVMGLVTALQLSRAGHSVHVLESEAQLGGLATWFDYKEFIWDKYYHVILRSDQHLINIIDELGLADKLHWTPTKTGFLWHGSYISMSNHWELLTFPALNAYQKLKLILGILRCQYIEDPTLLHQRKATEWLTSLFGPEVYNIVWDPLLDSKFGTLKPVIPASIMYSIITRYGSTRKTSSGQETMGYLAGGERTLIRELKDEIVKLGGQVTCNCAVTAIDDSNPDFVSLKTASGPFEFKKVINTLPTFLLRKLAPQLRGLPEKQQLPHFLGVICLSFVLKKKFSPYYVTNLIDKGFPFTGIIEPSNVAASKEFNGSHLLMLPRYDVPSSDWFNKSDEEIRSVFLKKLIEIDPDFEDYILNSFVNRAKLVQALWIDSPPPRMTPQRYSNSRIWSINSELGNGTALSNNSIVEIATKASKEFLDAERNSI